MIINCNGIKIIFVHVQKSGGSSIVNFFKKTKNHNKIKIDIKYLNKKKENINDYFKFTVIRNPWDRMVSFYHYHKEKILKNNNPTETWKYLKDLTFKKFLKSTKFQKWALVNNITDFINYNKKTHIDYYINFENFENDFKVVKQISGMENKLLEENKSTHKEYKHYYNDKSKKIIDFLFKKEIKFFNFKFDEKINSKILNKNSKIRYYYKKKHDN